APVDALPSYDSTDDAGEACADGWIPCAVRVHARGLHRLRNHRPRAGDPAYPAHVGLQLRARHRAGRRDGGARTGGHASGEGDRLPCGAAGCRQRRWRLRGHRTHARDVQVEQGGQQVTGALALLVKGSYFLAALLFILGIKRMASPVTARSGIRWAGAGMVLATLATFFYPGPDGGALHNLHLIAIALLVGVGLAWWSGKRVAMTDMPQMVALYNGMGGGSAAAIGAVE